MHARGGGNRDGHWKGGRGCRGSRLPWAMTLISMIVGIPLFFEIGVVLLMPVIVLMTRRSGSSIVRDMARQLA